MSGIPVASIPPDSEGREWKWTESWVCRDRACAFGEQLEPNTTSSWHEFGPVDALRCPCCSEEMALNLLATHLAIHDADTSITLTLAGEAFWCRTTETGIACPFMDDTGCPQAFPTVLAVYEHASGKDHREDVEHIYHNSGRIMHYRPDALHVIRHRPTPPTIRTYRGMPASNTRSRSASPTPRSTSSLKTRPRSPTPRPGLTPLSPPAPVINPATQESMSAAIPPRPPAPIAYAQHLDKPTDKVKTYNGIEYRKLRADPAILQIRIPHTFCGDHGQVDGIHKYVAFWAKKHQGVCIFHLIAPVAVGDRHRLLITCGGPLGTAECHYYAVFKNVLGYPYGVCYRCGTPMRSAPVFQHEVACTDNAREGYENIFRGVPYIVWRVESLRALVFTYLGIRHHVHAFVSTVDYARWLSQPFDPNAGRVLSNMMLIVFAFAKLLEGGRIPCQSYRLDASLASLVVRKATLVSVSSTTLRRRTFSGPSASHSHINAHSITALGVTACRCLDLPSKSLHSGPDSRVIQPSESNGNGFQAAASLPDEICPIFGFWGGRIGSNFQMRAPPSRAESRNSLFDGQDAQESSTSYNEVMAQSDDNDEANSADIAKLLKPRPGLGQMHIGSLI
ncbi:hypothetical protein D9758_016927 [Tetrapyrgos nigripes]|uniref:Uncharacterized protein n=1 Tax=Tetrapyrgos nigripes TaxID=182062 RepID=A0A8H5CLM5_9AGAR|nr:hypothetical protein D9758_016927 [Tetrapyrgos nigripes]